jgi:hypothetical protein
MKHVRDVMFLVMVASFMVGGYQPVSVLAFQDFCDDPEVCGPSEDCEKPCYVDLFENTCGGYGGVPVDPVEGNCLGECGDTYCNHYNDEDMYNCQQDCGGCGDGYCDSFESCSSCSTDCGPCHTGGGSCNPEEPEDAECGSDLCNPSGSCCTGIHVAEPPSGLGCGACLQDEVCRPSSGGNVWCITAGQDCTLN